MQPFLAYNLSTTTPSINLVWTLGFSGYLIGSTITSHFFKKYLEKGKFRKLLTFYFDLVLCNSVVDLEPVYINEPKQ
jgi:hypothetical protein